MEWRRKFYVYGYIEWIKYLVDQFLKPWGYKVNGTVSWQGEHSEDAGIIEITNNQVEVTTPIPRINQLIPLLQAAYHLLATAGPTAQDSTRRHHWLEAHDQWIDDYERLTKRTTNRNLTEKFEKMLQRGPRL